MSWKHKAENTTRTEEIKDSSLNMAPGADDDEHHVLSVGSHVLDLSKEVHCPVQKDDGFDAGWVTVVDVGLR